MCENKYMIKYNCLGLEAALGGDCMPEALLHTLDSITKGLDASQEVCA